MQQYYTFDQLVEQLPEICKEQRRFLQLTQADVVERLEKETGVRKDQSKISMFESGKIAIPDFLSDYCSILDIRFPAPSYRKEYLVEKKDVTREAIVNEMHYMKDVVTNIMLDIGYDIEEDHNEIDIISVEKYYCVRVSIPRICEDDIDYLTNNYIFAFMAAEDGPRLCGRMQVYSIFPVAYVNIPMDREILMYTDGETADLGEMGLYMHNVMSKYIKKKTKHSCEEIHDDLDLLPEELFLELIEHRILLIGDIYVYESDRKKGCFTAMMKYLYQWFGQDKCMLHIAVNDCGDTCWIDRKQYEKVKSGKASEDEKEELYDQIWGNTCGYCEISTNCQDLEYCNFMKQIKICGFSFIKNDVN